MKIVAAVLTLPKISLRVSVLLCFAMLGSGFMAYWAAPRLVEVISAPSLDETIPRQFGDWKEVSNPYVQVRLATGPEADLNQMYDQTVTRTYVNSQGQQVMLALAWGKQQRQEVKVHRPDLCYVAQGFTVKSLATSNFDDLKNYGLPIQGKHMVVMAESGGEAVAYWIRIGSIYSENAFETRAHIFKSGLAGRIPDGILVRASRRIQFEADAKTVFPVLEVFLSQLVAATPPLTRALLIQ